MKMMQIRRVGVAVNQGLMKVAMAVGFLPVATVLVPMMFVMNVPVFMKDNFMNMFVVMIFPQQKNDGTDRHGRRQEEFWSHRLGRRPRPPESGRR